MSTVFTLSVVQSMDLNNKSTMTCIHYYNIIWSIFTVPQILCALLTHVCFNNFQAVTSNKKYHILVVCIYTIDFIQSWKKRNFTICNNMDGSSGYYSKSDRKKTNITWCHLMWTLKKQTRTQNKNRLTDKLHKQGGRCGWVEKVKRTLRGTHLQL